LWPDPIETAWDFGERQVSYYEMPEIIACATGSIATVGLQTYDEHEDNSLRGLPACGVTEETLLTMLEMSDVTVMVQGHIKASFLRPALLGVSWLAAAASRNSSSGRVC